MRRCQSCGRKQTDNPTLLERALAGANGLCICWYEATARIKAREEREVQAMETELRIQMELAADSAQALLQEVAPVHDPCGEAECRMCKS